MISYTRSIYDPSLSKCPENIDFFVIFEVFDSKPIEDR